MNYRTIKFRSFNNHTGGSLSFFDNYYDISFEIKRVYYIYGATAGTNRGMHAHKALKQLLFCPYGSVEIILTNTKEKVSVILDKPDKGLIIEPCIWREIIWNIDNSILCVMASDYYDESDYIRDFIDYEEYMKGLKK